MTSAPPNLSRARGPPERRTLLLLEVAPSPPNLRKRSSWNYLPTAIIFSNIIGTPLFPGVRNCDHPEGLLKMSLNRTPIASSPFGLSQNTLSVGGTKEERIRTSLILGVMLERFSLGHSGITRLLILRQALVFLLPITAAL